MRRNFSNHPHNESLGDFFLETCKHFSDKIAYNYLGKDLSYKDLMHHSMKIAVSLQEDYNIQPGDRVAIMMPNCLQFPIALFGILLAGGIVVNVNPQYTPRELQHQLTDSGAKIIFVLDHVAHIVEQCLDQTPIKHIVITGLSDFLPAHKALIVNLHLRYIKKMSPQHKLTDTQNFMGLLSTDIDPKWQPYRSEWEDIAFIQYTGGTTGPSKGAALTHKNILYNVHQGLDRINKKLFSEDEINILLALPMYHIFALTVSLISLSQGAKGILVVNARNTSTLIKTIKTQPIHGIALIQTLMSSLMQHKNFDSISWDHLKQTINGGMKTNGDTAKRWYAKTGCIVDEGYGLSETSPIVSLSNHKHQFSETVGKPVPHTLVKIMKNDNTQVAHHESGEVWVKGPQVMKGYWQRNKETFDAITADGWFKTGDVGIFTSKGELKLIDRIKDIIIVSGFNIYPREVEEVIEMHPDVIECGVIGEKKENNEIVCAYVVSSDPKITKHAIKEFCRKNLAAYKVPKKVIFVYELPKSNIGKVLRRKLRVA